MSGYSGQREMQETGRNASSAGFLIFHGFSTLQCMHDTSMYCTVNCTVHCTTLSTLLSRALLPELYSRHQWPIDYPTALRHLDKPGSSWPHIGINSQPLKGFTPRHPALLQMIVEDRILYFTRLVMLKSHGYIVGQANTRGGVNIQPSYAGNFWRWPSINLALFWQGYDNL